MKKMSNELEADCRIALKRDPDGKPDQAFVNYYADRLANQISFYEGLFNGHDFMADKALVEIWRGRWLADGYTHKQVADMADAFRSVFRHNHGRPNMKLRRTRFLNCLRGRTGRTAMV